MDTRKVWRHDPRMFVGTMKLFRGAFHDEFQIIVFADVQSARAKHCKDLLRDRPDATWYALTAAQQALSDYERFQLEEVFGPVVDGDAADGTMSRLHRCPKAISRIAGVETANACQEMTSRTKQRNSESKYSGRTECRCRNGRDSFNTNGERRLIQ